MAILNGNSGRHDRPKREPAWDLETVIDLVRQGFSLRNSSGARTSCIECLRSSNERCEKRKSYCQELAFPRKGDGGGYKVHLTGGRRE